VEAIIRSISLQRFVSFLVELGGVKGTLAVGLAWAAHLDLFASFSLDVRDVGIAVGLAIPILIVDAVLMAPDWSEAPHMAALNSAMQAAPGDSAAGGVSEPAPAGAAAAPQDAGAWAQFVEAAAMFQTIKVRANPAMGLSAVQESALIIVGHIADEMLARGVILGWGSLWVRDRLYEADSLTFWSDQTNEQAAPWFALAFILAIEIARKWKSLSRSMTVQAAVVGKDKITGKTKVTPIDKDRLDDVASQPAVARTLNSTSPERLAAIQAQVSAARQRAASVAQMDSLRSLLDWMAYGSAFIISHGNLCGPVVASTLTDALFSSYQRKGAARLAARQRARVESATAELRAKMNAVAGLGSDAAAPGVVEDGSKSETGQPGEAETKDDT
jgi:hypothetical protein